MGTAEPDLMRQNKQSCLLKENNTQALKQLEDMSVISRVAGRKH
jgi:hypothetical protein